MTLGTSGSPQQGLEKANMRWNLGFGGWFCWGVAGDCGKSHPLLCSTFPSCCLWTLYILWGVNPPLAVSMTHPCHGTLHSTGTPCHRGTAVGNCTLKNKVLATWKILANYNISLYSCTADNIPRLRRSMLAFSFHPSVQFDKYYGFFFIIGRFTLCHWAPARTERLLNCSNLNSRNNKLQRSMIKHGVHDICKNNYSAFFKRSFG